MKDLRMGPRIAGSAPTRMTRYTTPSPMAPLTRIRRAFEETQKPSPGGGVAGGDWSVVLGKKSPYGSDRPRKECAAVAAPHAHG